MAICSKCGNNIKEDTKFCTICGNTAESRQNSTSASNNSVSDFLNSADHTAKFDPADIAAYKIMALFSYLGFLFLVPLFGATNSKFARFHANQGILLFMLVLLINIPYRIAEIIANHIKIFSIIEIPLAIISSLPWILAIYGIYNALSGKARELPLIGRFRVLILK